MIGPQAGTGWDETPSGPTLGGLNVVVELRVWETLDWMEPLRQWAGQRGLGPVSLARREGGKPFFLERPDWHFNVSTTRGRTVAALSRVEVGIDWEWRHRVASFARIARRYFFPEEAAWLEDSPEANRAERFYGLWTAKEAGVKLDGRGLYRGGLCALRVEVPLAGWLGRGWMGTREIQFRRVVWEGEFILTVAAWGHFRLALPCKTRGMARS